MTDVISRRRATAAGAAAPAPRDDRADNAAARFGEFTKAQCRRLTRALGGDPELGTSTHGFPIMHAMAYCFHSTPCRKRMGRDLMTDKDLDVRNIPD
ncbi:hypothetical protein [Mycobacterium innocens]|uniref:hypothetical protein n=1 Tax=Mycobacterium innocens TaxID=2341083 RepID=UPI0010A95CDB|nr:MULTISPECIES: hypothetical protein [Mycobacterium]